MKRLLLKISRKPFFIRLLHWEYWSFNTVYFFLYPVFIWYCVRARSFFFFTAANPTIENGGFLMESKTAIDKLIPYQYKPYTLRFASNTKVNDIITQLQQVQLDYPLIIKPDIGARGRGVKKIESDTELASVLPNYNMPFIVQPFIPFPKEIGLFYVRKPNETAGRITGIVRKEFVEVTGDGERSILQLLEQNKRYVLQIPILEKTLGTYLQKVLPAGISEILVPYGNHARGCLFIDDSHLITPQLEAVFNHVCKQIDGFYYGRLDIRYNSWEELLQGKNFSIIELNGAGSEPTHIYDPSHSIFFAWREIIRHWAMLYDISVMNKKMGIDYMPMKEGKQMFIDNSHYERLLNSLTV